MTKHKPSPVSRTGLGCGAVVGAQPHRPQPASTHGSAPADSTSLLGGWGEAGGEQGDFPSCVGGGPGSAQAEPAGPFLMDDGTWQEALACGCTLPVLSLEAYRCWDTAHLLFS